MNQITSGPFRTEIDPSTEYINVYTMKDHEGNIRLTLETSQADIADAQTISLVLSGKQAQIISKLITTSLEGPPNVVQNVDEVE